MRKNFKKALITGGAGFIGYHLAKRLVNEGFYVDIIDNLSRGKIDSDFKNLLKNKKINFFKHDFFKNNLILNKNYNFIFHLAAIVGVKNVISKPYEVLEKNVKLLLNTIKCAKKQKKLKRFFFLSTSEVYAGSLKHKILNFPTKESNIISLDDLNNNRSTYMLSKIYGEALCQFSGLPFTILRPHNIFGERMGMSHVIPELTKKVLSKNKFITVYNSNHTRTFCYIDDAIEMIIRIMKSKKTLYRTYNLGDPRQEIKIYDLAKKIIKIVNKNKKIKSKKINNFSPKRRSPRMTKLLKEIDFKLNSSLNSNLIKTVKWYKKNFLK